MMPPSDYETYTVRARSDFADLGVNLWCKIHGVIDFFDSGVSLWEIMAAAERHEDENPKDHP